MHKDKNKVWIIPVIIFFTGIFTLVITRQNCMGFECIANIIYLMIIIFAFISSIITIIVYQKFKLKWWKALLLSFVICIILTIAFIIFIRISN